MTNEEVTKQLQFLKKVDFHVDTKETCDFAINAIQENDNLKAEIEQLKQRLEIKDNNFELYSDALDEIEQLKETISKMETTTIDEKKSNRD